MHNLLSRCSRTVLVTVLAIVFLLSPTHASPLTSTAAADLKSDPWCTVTSPVSGSFIDLRDLIRKEGQTDWSAKGHDYNTNFTINFCSSIASPPDSVHYKFLDPIPQSNVSALYTKSGNTYSIGQSLTQPHFRGRKVVLEYTGGSLCPKLDDQGRVIDGEENTQGYRKSALLAMTCDRELLLPAAVSFVGVLNECSYFFEVRTASACPTVKQQALGPISIFGVIALIALVVYFVGGCVYQRTVMHARGWRQLPHWQTWSSMFGFVWDILQIIFYSITSIFTGRKRGTYTSISSAPRASTEGRNNNANANARVNGWDDVDDENRLIDELGDDDWDDERDRR